MVDRAVEAIHAHLRDGDAANLGGPFEASRRTGELVDRARRTVGELLGAPPEGIVFGVMVESRADHLIAGPEVSGHGPGEGHGERRHVGAEDDALGRGAE